MDRRTLVLRPFSFYPGPVVVIGVVEDVATFARVVERVRREVVHIARVVPQPTNRPRTMTGFAAKAACAGNNAPIGARASTSREQRELVQLDHCVKTSSRTGEIGSSESYCLSYTGLSKIHLFSESQVYPERLLTRMPMRNDSAATPRLMPAISRNRS